MQLQESPQGIHFSGDLEFFPMPFLLGLLSQAKVIGELSLETSNTTGTIAFINGSIVGIQWNEQPLSLKDSEKELITILVKEILPAFKIKRGSFSFTPKDKPEPHLVKPDKLPALFLIRYALARISDKSLTNRLFNAVFINRPVFQITDIKALEILGTSAKNQLMIYQQKTRITPNNIELTERQLLLSLWCSGQLDIAPESQVSIKFNDILNKIKNPQFDETTLFVLPEPLSVLEYSVDEEELNIPIEAPPEKRKAIKEEVIREIQEVSSPDISDELTQQINANDGIKILLSMMEEWNASDLFVCEGKIPALRIHGKVLKLSLEPTTSEAMNTFLEMAVLPLSLEHFYQEGDLDIGYSLDTKRRFRLNIHRQKGLIAIVIRAIPTGELFFGKLGLPPTIEEFSKLSRGLLLVTGATGSGKSTTLASMINHINKTRSLHIVTIEEPIEFIHEDKLSHVTQREVGADTQSFQTALRHVVRESPDVILIGEMRDMETISIAISAALTGHFVLASLHTIDATQTLQRIMSYYPEHLREQAAMDLSLCLQGIVSQRLVPSRHGGDRVLAVEVVKCTAAVSQLLKQQRIDELGDLMRNSTDPQLFSFNRSLLELYKSGAISYEVGKAYATNPDEFALSAQGMETGMGTFYEEDSLPSSNQLDMKILLKKVIEHHASDLHLTSGRPPILRVNGKLKNLPYASLSDADMRLLLYSILSIRQRSTYQLEREIDFALSLETGQRFRVNAYYQKGKMATSLRVIPSKIPDPKALNIPEKVMSLADNPHGLLLVVGPTGSGKSTTLACMIDRINQQRSCRIITVEDPIEFTHTSINATIDQREVHSDTKDFASALKYVLRQDPDVIQIGEMRDLETISAAMTAAETGHLVLATLHTNNAIQTIDRIIDAFPSHQQSQVRSQLSSCLLGVISQRLLLRKDATSRIAAFEIMIATPAIRHLIRDDKMHQAQSAIETSKSIGMITLDDSLKELYQKEAISLEDAVRYISNPQLLQAKRQAPKMPQYAANQVSNNSNYPPASPNQQNRYNSSKKGRY